MLDWLTFWRNSNAEEEGSAEEANGSAECWLCGNPCMDPDVDGQGFTLDEKPICINCDLEGSGLD